MYYEFPIIDDRQLKLISLNKSEASQLQTKERQERQELVQELKQLFDRFKIVDRDARLDYLRRLVLILQTLDKQLPLPREKIKKITNYNHWEKNTICGYYVSLKTVVSRFFAPATLLDLPTYSAPPDVIKFPEKFFYSYYSFFDVSHVKPLTREYWDDDISKEHKTVLRDYGYPLEITEDNFYQFLPHQPKHKPNSSNGPIYRQIHQTIDRIAELLTEAGFPMPSLKPSPPSQSRKGAVTYLWTWKGIGGKDFFSEQYAHIKKELNRDLGRHVANFTILQQLREWAMETRVSGGNETEWDRWYSHASKETPTEHTQYSGGWTQEVMVAFINHNLALLRKHLGQQMADALVDYVTTYYSGRQRAPIHGYQVSGRFLLTLCHLIVTIRQNPSFRLDPGEMVNLVMKMQRGRIGSGRENLLFGHGAGRTVNRDLILAGFLSAKESEKLAIFREVTGLKISQDQLAEININPGDVRALNYWNNHLPALSSDLCRLTNLMSIDLKHNQLSALPECVGDLTSLKSFTITNNKLTQLPDVIGNLTGLTRLDLHNNKLIRLPISLTKLSQLEFLDLTANSIRFGTRELKRKTHIEAFFKDYFSVPAKRYDGIDLTSWSEISDCTASHVNDELISQLAGLEESADRTTNCSEIVQQLGKASDDVLLRVICEICGDVLFDGQPLAELECGHWFHYDELLEYVDGGDKAECPVCGAVFYLGLM